MEGLGQNNLEWEVLLTFTCSQFSSMVLFELKISQLKMKAKK